MQHARSISLATALLLVTPTVSTADHQVTGPVDKAGFQALVDGTGDGDTIRCLGGVYDFSAPGAVLITKGLRIVADDVDNPPVFLGALTPEGNWASGADLMLPPPTNLTGNTAFAVPTGAVVDDLRIEGLHLVGFERAIYTGVGFSLESCTVLASPGSLTDLLLKDNYISNCRFGIQLLGGPLEDFTIQDNTIDCSTGTAAVNVQGDEIPCGAPRANTQRLRSGQIKGNTLFGGPTPPMTPQNTALQVAGVEDVQVKGNTIFAHPTSRGIIVRDIKAFTFGPFAGATPPFGDDGPIELGEIKDNVIHNAFLGITCQTPTTMTDVQIKGNTFVDTVAVDILLQNPGNVPPAFKSLGSNGFVVKGNIFSGTTFDADVKLASATFNNLVKVPAGTNVVDLGNNTVTFE